MTSVSTHNSGWASSDPGKDRPVPAPATHLPPSILGVLPAEISNEKTASTFRGCWPQLVIVWLASIRRALPVEGEPGEPSCRPSRLRNGPLALLPVAGPAVAGRDASVPGVGARTRMVAMPPFNFLSGMDEFPNQSAVASLSFHVKTRLH